MTPLQTEVEFTLPKGYADDEGTLHRDGVMRLATAADEIQPLKDPRVKVNASYLSVILLSRVIMELGDIDEVTPHVVENLFVSDLAYLQNLYARVNEYGADVVEAVCPECGETFEAEVSHRDDHGHETTNEVVPGNPNPVESAMPTATPDSERGPSSEGVTPENRRSNPK